MRRGFYHCPWVAYGALGYGFISGSQEKKRRPNGARIEYALEYGTVLWRSTRRISPGQECLDIADVLATG